MRSTPDLQHLLGNVGLFAGCTRKELAEVSAWAEDRKVPSGTVLVREGDPGHEFMVLAEGLARVSVGGVELASVMPGTTIGELAMLDDLPRSATVTTALPSRVLVFDRAAFDRLLDDVPVVRTRMLRTMASRLRKADALAQ